MMWKVNVYSVGDICSDPENYSEEIDDINNDYNCLDRIEFINDVISRLMFEKLYLEQLVKNDH